MRLRQHTMSVSKQKTLFIVFFITTITNRHIALVYVLTERELNFIAVMVNHRTVEHRLIDTSIQRTLLSNPACPSFRCSVGVGKVLGSLYLIRKLYAR